MKCRFFLGSELAKSNLLPSTVILSNPYFHTLVWFGLVWFLCSMIICRLLKSVLVEFHISIIHPRCIKDVFSDATVFIADFKLFLHHIGSDRNSGMTLEEPSCLRDRDVLRSCLYQSKEKLNKGRTSAVLIDICPLVNS